MASKFSEAQAERAAELVLDRIARGVYKVEDGWDVINECYSTDDLVELFRRLELTNWTAQYKHLMDIISVYNDRVADAKNSAF